MTDLLQTLLAATTARNVTSAIELFMDEGEVKWMPVGDRENNLATINLGSDPAAGLIERITNAIDAVLEREWHERREPSHLRSPREAVAEWFGIADGRLQNVADPRSADYQSLTQRVRVVLHDSEKKRYPTVDIRDRGLGILAQDFRRSILSLNETRKLKKFFLAGAFGQGGSTALSYSLFTIIASRRAEVAAESEAPVAATVVRFNPGDLKNDKHGLYEYMVDGATGQPFTFTPPEGQFEVGTLVRHVCMDLGKYDKILTAPVNSVWYLTHHYLFDPVLPIRLVEQRSNNVQGTERSMSGNYRRLQAGEHTQYRRSASRTFRAGSVTVSWWVLSFDSERGDAKARIANYCLASKPIVITYNGQKQGELPNTLVKADLKLPYLDRFLVVHVDCDRLDNESRRQLFPTTRENLRETSLLDELRQLVLNTLAADEELHRLDRDRRQRYMRRVDNQSVEAIRRRLASRIEAVRSATTGGSGPRTTNAPQPGGGSAVPAGQGRPSIPTQEPPTFIEITSANPRPVYAGRSFVLNFKTDADASYFLNPDAFIAIIDPPTTARYTGTTTLHKGYGTAYFKAADNAEVGTDAEITLELRPNRARALDATSSIVVEPPPEDVADGPGGTATPNINPQFIDRNHPWWRDRGWDESWVAEVQRGEEGVDIYVSAENRNLTRIIGRAQRHGVSVVEAFKDFYLEHVCFHALLSDLHVGLDDQTGSTNDEDGTATVDPQEEMRRMGETVCGIMNQMFEFIATGATADE